MPDVPHEIPSAIITNSPVDRLVGMLLERLETMRSLHNSLREEASESRRETMQSQLLLQRLVDKLESHEQADRVAFESITNGHSLILNKLEGLTTQIQQATTTNIIQKTQLASGYRVIAWLGAVVLGVVAIFAVFYNHRPGP